MIGSDLHHASCNNMHDLLLPLPPPPRSPPPPNPTHPAPVLDLGDSVLWTCTRSIKGRGSKARGGGTTVIAERSWCALARHHLMCAPTCVRWLTGWFLHPLSFACQQPLTLLHPLLRLSCAALCAAGLCCILQPGGVLLEVTSSFEDPQHAGEAGGGTPGSCAVVQRAGGGGGGGRPCCGLPSCSQGLIVTCHLMQMALAVASSRM